MKNKVVIIIVSIVFIAGLFAINGILKKQEKPAQNENFKEEKMSILDVTSENFEKEVLKSEKPVLVDFYADWCGPCKMISPIVDEIAAENEDIKVCRINIDNEESLAVQYGIMSIPTLLVFKSGEVTNQTIGVVSKSEILEMLK